MELQIEKVKDKMIMCRFAPEVFAQIEKLAAKIRHQTGKSFVLS